ncbi:tripartite ATP-independent transporter DctM subunit [Pacificibacter maritimus]|uniref:TRAP transporter large permease protein n=1 Tax=Pacificibacter maritimus TaxID=762213 RepID=A0A3N4VGT5_9RHOB|nr:TRAP transporter large permease [Pacificibacter maritimus]RPE72144.1 tripartite ATP-independent transporter DctM subunit [Pacificibacter maritimus]
MSEVTIGLFGIAGMFVLLALRVPVAMSMLAAGFFGTWALHGERSAVAVLSSETFSAVSSYSLIVIPLFILMGNIASAAGFSRGLYELAYAWVGRFRGGLASASILGCAAFSAVSGSSVATAVTIGRVAIPEMNRYKYSSSMATGAVAAGGTLGFLIPPSTGFVLYSILTEQSLGRLFMAGILPGILLTLLFVGAILVTTTLDPKAGPHGEVVPMRQRFERLIGASPLISVIFISIGGIYAGVFTPVEAAGVGAFLVLVFAVLGRKLDLKGIHTAFMDTVKTSTMLYVIVIGAGIFSPFLALTGIPQSLSDMLSNLGLGALGTLIVILLAYVVLGMFMDALSMIVITIPIVFPIIVSLGYDPIWFGVIAVIVIEMGMITPPVGINVFVVKAIAPNVPMGTIFRGVLPFWIAMLVALVLLIAFPEIALFIPNSMFG